jgi:fructokinase
VTRVAPRRAVRVVDTVGAGDAFAAVTLAGLLRGWTTSELLQRAVDFSGHICEVRGAVPGDLALYREWTAGWRSAAPDPIRA